MQEIVGLALLSTSGGLIAYLTAVTTMPARFRIDSRRDVGVLILAAATCMWGAAACTN